MGRYIPVMMDITRLIMGSSPSLREKRKSNGIVQPVKRSGG